MNLSQFRLLLLVAIGFSTSTLYATELDNLSSADRDRVKVSINKNTGNVGFLSVIGSEGLTSRSKRRPQAPGVAATEFLTTYGIEFGITNSNPLRELNEVSSSENENPSARSRHSVKYQQNRNGIPIFGAQIIVRLDSGFNVTGANGNMSSTPMNYKLSTDTAAGRNAARAVIAKNIKQAGSLRLSISDPKMVIYNAAIFGKGVDQERPANLYELINASGDINYTVIVDAETNAVLTYFNNNKHAKNRQIHDQNQNFALPLPSGNVVRSEGDSAYGQTDVDNAYDYSGDTYDFLLTEHGRDSLDGAGFPLVSAVRHCESGDCPFANAFWNGVHMTYGTGFAVDDVVGHELIHGFTEFTSNLIYLNESGAINESFSDIWGEWVDLVNGAGDDSPGVRWLLGEDIPNIGPLRNMQNPQAFGHPDRVSSPNYVCATHDNGGVHSNSGVNNKAAVLMTDGGSFNGFTVNALGLSKTADIYYQAQTTYLTQSSGYNDLYNALNASCNDLIGTGGITAADCVAVDNALLAVEMDSAVCPTEPIVEYCPVGETMVSAYSEGFESGTLNGWTINNMVGTNGWFNTGAIPFSGTRHVHGNNPNTTTDSALEMSGGVTIPVDSFVAFDHIPNMESNYDGGVVEYTTDSGVNWFDLMTTAPTVEGLGYTGVLNNTSNPISGRPAFYGGVDYQRTKLTLPNSFTGETLRLRFRTGTDSLVAAPGWDIDNVEIYQCGIPSGKTCAGSLVTVDLSLNQVPTNGNDVILGTGGDDIIYGLGGNDLICGGNGADTIRGGDGYDIIYGGAGNDKLFGDNFYDDLYGGTGNDFLYGGTDSHTDFLYGQAGADTLFDQNGSGGAWGGAGPDNIYAGPDGVYAEGGAQNDRLFGGPGVDNLFGESGADVIGGYGGNDFLYGGEGLDNINGGSNDDYVEGGPGNDTIRGGGGADTLHGNSEHDTIIGGAGADLIYGGAGADTMNGQGQDDLCVGGAGIDVSLKCETLTGTPLQALSPPAALLPSVRPTAAILNILDTCDATIFECLTVGQRAQLQR